MISYFSDRGAIPRSSTNNIIKYHLNYRGYFFVSSSYRQKKTTTCE